MVWEVGDGSSPQHPVPISALWHEELTPDRSPLHNPLLTPVTHPTCAPHACPLTGHFNAQAERSLELGGEGLAIMGEVPGSYTQLLPGLCHLDIPTAPQTQCQELIPHLPLLREVLTAPRSLVFIEETAQGTPSCFTIIVEKKNQVPSNLEVLLI